MRFPSKFIIFALAGCSVGPPGDDQTTAARDESALRGIVAEYETAWNASDQRALGQLFAEDASQFLEKLPPSHGVAEISLNSIAARETERRKRCFRPITIAANDDLGYVVGAYAFDKSGIDAGSFVMTLRRNAQGDWRVESMLENSCNPNRPNPKSEISPRHTDSGK